MREGEGGGEGRGEGRGEGGGGARDSFYEFLKSPSSPPSSTCPSPPSFPCPEAEGGFMGGDE